MHHDHAGPGGLFSERDIAKALAFARQKLELLSWETLSDEELNLRAAQHVIDAMDRLTRDINPLGEDESRISLWRILGIVWELINEDMERRGSR